MDSIRKIIVSKDIIIIETQEKKIRLRNYNIQVLKVFIRDILNRHYFDVSINTTLSILNRDDNVTSRLKLIYSSYYEYVDDRCIAKLVGEIDMDNDTLNFYNFRNEKHVIKLSYGIDEIFQKLYDLLETTIVGSKILE